MRSSAALSFVVCASIGLVASPPLEAQERPRSAVEVAGGVLLFPDDGTVREGLVGGAGRVYVRPRIGIGPEVAFVSGTRHSHLMLTANVTVDLVAPIDGEPRPVTPFVVVGAGLFQTSEQFPNGTDFTSSEGAFTAGGGVRARAGRHLFVGAEARVGWELHIRVNALVGLSFGY